MDYTQEYFSSELTLPRLLEWFNGQDEEDRTVVAGQMFIVRVKVLLNASGEPVFAIGIDPTTGDPTRSYLGETVYLWIGASGTNLVADETSFFELSKFIVSKNTGGGGAINVIPFNGTTYIAGEVDIPVIIRRMAYGYNYNYNYNGSNGNTYGLTGDGNLEIHSDIGSYMEINTNLQFITVINGTDGWAAGLTEEGQVYAWGTYGGVTEFNHTEPTLIDLGSVVIKQIAALPRALVMLTTDGDLGTIGNIDYLPGGYNAPEDSQQPVQDISNVKDIKSMYFTRYDGEKYDMHVYLSILTETGDFIMWGSVVSDYFNDPHQNYNGTGQHFGLKYQTPIGSTPVVDVGGCDRFMYARLEDGSVFSTGSEGLSFDYPSYSGEYPQGVIVDVQVTGVDAVPGNNNRQYVVALTEDGTVWTSPCFEFNPYWEITNYDCSLIAAGQTDIIALMDGNTIANCLNYSNEPVMLNQPVKSLFNGHGWRCAVLEDGSLTWWEQQL